MYLPVNVSSISIFSFLDYYIGEKGEVCNDASHVIRSKEECLIAVQSVGLQANSELKKGRNKEMPSGCSINDSGYPHYDNSSTGLGTGHEELAPICHDPLKSGILNSNMRNLNFRKIL